MSDRSTAGRLAYPTTVLMLGLALAFPIALMVLNPTLMFERGWEQFVGTGIYLWAVLTLGRELVRLWGEERTLTDAPALLKTPEKISEGDRRVLPGRLRQLAAHRGESGTADVAGLMELNREASGLDQESAHGRLTLTRYILYLLPVIGFIGTVEGISKALMNISKVLPMVRDLDGFMSNLTNVTSALQIAFDSTLLALFLSAALMLVQTLVARRSDDLLARIDRWIVERVLPVWGREREVQSQPEVVLAEVRTALEVLAMRLGDGFAAQVDRLGAAVDRLTPSVNHLQLGAEAIGRLGADLAAAGQAGEALREGVAALGRIEAALNTDPIPDPQLERIQAAIAASQQATTAIVSEWATTWRKSSQESAARLESIEQTLSRPKGQDPQLEQIRVVAERSCAATEALAEQWSAAFERSSRATQEQLARTMNNLKDALDLLHVSMEQGNALYRNIVKKMLPVYHGPSDERAA
jgi:biopolymer transport protein ExbB/TolQ